MTHEQGYVYCVVVRYDMWGFSCCIYFKERYLVNTKFMYNSFHVCAIELIYVNWFLPQKLTKVLLTGNVWFGHVPPDNEKLHKKR